MDKRVLVVGATGMVGSALMRQLQLWPNVTALGTYYSQPTEDYVYLELENFRSIDAVIKTFHPNLVFIPGAITDVDRCEIDASTYRVNVEAVQYLAEQSKTQCYKPVFYSSPYVFDGRINSPYSIYRTPNPLNEYGLQKLLAEKAILDVDGLVVRTIGVFGVEEKRKNFAYQVVDGLSLGKKLFFTATDQFLNPVLSDDLALNSIQAVMTGLHGVIHLAGSELVSKYQFACDIADVFDLPKELIQPIVSTEFHRKALRPSMGGLVNTIEPRYDYYESLEVMCEHF